MAGDVTFGVRLTGDSSGATQALTLTRAELDRLGREMGQVRRQTRELDRGFQDWARSMVAVGTRLAAVATGVGAVAVGTAVLVEGVVSSVAAMDQQAESLGVSSEAWQRLTSVFAHFGLESGQVGEGLLAVASAASGAIQSAGSERQAFEALGLSVDDLRGKNPYQLLLAMADGFSRMDDKTRRAALASKLFGEDLALVLLPALVKGKQRIIELGKQAHVLGGDLTDVAVRVNGQFKELANDFEFYVKAGVLEVVQFVEQMAVAVEPFFERLATANPSIQAAQTLRAQIDAVNEKIEAGSATLKDRIRLTRLLHQLETATAGIPTMPPVTVTGSSSAPMTSGGTVTRAPAAEPAAVHRFAPMEGYLADVARAHQDQWLGATDAADKFNDKQEEIVNINRQLQGLAVQTAADFTSAFASAASGAKSFGDAMRDLAASLTVAITKALILKAIQTYMLVGDGAAFGGSGDVLPFANGGVVDGPTPFRFGGNRLGIMGESGPEAVMPLTRIGGKLGVQAIGGGGNTTTITQNIAISMTGGTQSEIARLRTEIAVASAQAARAGADGGYLKVADDLARDGPLSHRMRSR